VHRQMLGLHLQEEQKGCKEAKKEDNMRRKG